MELVKSNQNSPLLRLPPEIRNRIWEYALGHTVFRAYTERVGRKYVSAIVPLPNEPSISVSLLRTCRQIYSEAAPMPTRLNIFAFSGTRAFEKATKQLNPFQRKQITAMRFEASTSVDWELTTLWKQSEFTSIYPAVKAFQIILFDMANQAYSVSVIEAQIREKHGAFLEHTGISLTVEGVNGMKTDSLYSES